MSIPGPCRNYLRHGVTVWLDVPLEALAERVVAVGTHTRPLLGESQGDSAFHQVSDKSLLLAGVFRSGSCVSRCMRQND